MPRALRIPPRRATALLLLLAATALALTACGRAADDTPGGTPARVGVKAKSTDAAKDLGFPVFATKNTTRIAGADPVADAAGAARAVFSGATAQARPRAVALVDRKDWRATVAAAVLDAPPIHAPMLLTDGPNIPAATQGALDALKPTGSKAAGDAQVIRVGNVPRVADYKTTDLTATDPFAMARALDAFSAAARGQTSDAVVVVSADAPQFAMPAAAWAAKSGDPVLFVTRNTVPPDTRAAIEAHQRPHIYVLGPSEVISPKVTRSLRRLGPVKRVGGQTPIRNAIEFAAYGDGAFGWRVSDPGHGLVFVPVTADPATAGAVAPLSASGTYGPMVLLGGPDKLPKQLQQYLLDIQPGYDKDPARGVYNRGWIIGDAKAVSPALQSLIDRYLEIVPVSSSQSALP